MEQEATIRDLQPSLMRATENETRNRNIEQTAQVLFECLMNRIYNASDFERLGAMNSRERDAIDAWLTLQGEPNAR